ncbi:hypothetical protein SOVF_110260 [Spinacia oleracea]|nr:hypothetical protein SOVF_110260 [Spinacia oleracea]
MGARHDRKSDQACARGGPATGQPMQPGQAYNRDVQRLPFAAHVVLVLRWFVILKAHNLGGQPIEPGIRGVNPQFHKPSSHQTYTWPGNLTGNRMRAALFGNQVDVYKEAIEHLGSYEIANATIKPSDEYWKAKDAKYGLLGYQMSFGSQAVIQRINVESSPILPEYQCLATIPRVYDPTNRFAMQHLARATPLAKGYNTQRPMHTWGALLVDGVETFQQGTTYTCTRCKANTVSTPKITYNFVASDGTGTMECTSFTEDSEKLFRMTAADTFRMKHSDDAVTFEQLQEMLKSNHFLLEIGPTVGLSKNGVLEWCLKLIALEPEEAQAENVEHHFADQQPEQGPSASQVLAQAMVARQQLEQPTLRRKHPK